MGESRRIVLIHTVKLLVEEFERLCSNLLPETKVFHVLDELILERIRQRGEFDIEDGERLANHVIEAEKIGSAAVLVTCSTISPLVDLIRDRTPLPIYKIDDAMIDEALKFGSRVGVLATNPTTLLPTSQLLMAHAKQIHKSIELELVVVENAFQALQEGKTEIHDHLVKTSIDQLIDSQKVDVVVLAQASMARVLSVDKFDFANPIKVLASPSLALEKVKSFLGGGK